jgi:CRP-like cAMP-binding protein
VVEVAAGAAVLERGDEDDRSYVIESGEAEVILRDDRRTRLGSGDSFGEIALLRDVPRQATVCAITDLALPAIDRQVFLRV